MPRFSFVCHVAQGFDLENGGIGAGRRSVPALWGIRAFELPASQSGRLGAERRFLYGVRAHEERGTPYFSAIQRVDTRTGMLKVRDFGTDFVGEALLVRGRNGCESSLLTLSTVRPIAIPTLSFSMPRS